MVCCFVIEPAETFIAAQTKYISNTMNTRPLYDEQISWIRNVKVWQNTYKSERSSLRPSLTLVADCIKLGTSQTSS